MSLIMFSCIGKEVCDIHAPSVETVPCFTLSYKKISDVVMAFKLSSGKLASFIEQVSKVGTLELQNLSIITLGAS